MFCSKCGTELQSDAGFCSECGQATSSPAVTTVPSPSVSQEQVGAIWNPDAASSWSVFFSPAFGSYLHALNWRTLGDAGKEKSAMGWFYFSLAILGVCVLMPVFMENPEEAGDVVRVLIFLNLIVWYFSTGRAQARYVKEKFGSRYPRRAWGKPLLIGMAAIIGYWILIIIVDSIIGSASM